MAAEQGDTLAMGMIGIMYRDGIGVPLDCAEASKWFRKSAEQGEPMRLVVKLLRQRHRWHKSVGGRSISQGR